MNLAVPPSEPLLSVLIPVYSEEESLEQTVATVRELLASFAFEVLLLVHPRSSAECLEICRRLESLPHTRMLIQQRTPGQGFAFREGISAACGKYVLMMNSDLETNPDDVPRLLQSILEHGDDLVVASRWARGGFLDARGYGYLKWLLNWGFQQLLRLLVSRKISDYTFCFKIARRGLLAEIPWRGTQHEFAMESTLVPVLRGCKVREIPTRWVARRAGASHFKLRMYLRYIKLVCVLLSETRKDAHQQGSR
jgi:dolichol-phosphate mannosyltransferase